MKKLNLKSKHNQKAITLIALVITIIILLILAGITIAALTGENGILTRAKHAKIETTKAQLKEEIELEIMNIQIENKNDQTKVREQVIKKMNEIGTVTDSTDILITGEYKDYQFEIDEKYNVTIGDELKGAKPTATYTITATDVNTAEIHIIASTTEGEIESIIPISQATLKTEINNAEKIFTVTENGKYYFKIKGTNGRTTSIMIEVKEIIKQKTLLGEISKIKESGVQKIEVEGKTSLDEEEESKTYSLNIIRYDGNLTLDATTMVEGATLENNVYSFGTEDDVASASKYAENTVVLMVEGDLTINSDVTLTSVKSTSYGGPKGLVVYCTGKLTNNGTITMDARGAKAIGENVYLWQNNDGTYEYIPALGASGGARVSVAESCGFYGIIGNTGETGNNRQSGGGGSGAAVHCSCQLGTPHTITSGIGTAGTSYSGGSGGGGTCASTSYGDASANGGAGGNGSIVKQTINI